MSGFSAQTVAAFVILGPGLLFLVGTTFFRPSTPTRIAIQRGLVLDTAVFVLISAMLHGSVGVPLLFAADHVATCDVIGSFATAAGAATLAGPSCSLRSELLMVVGYGVAVGLAALVLGRFLAWLVVQRPQLFTALYGPFYELRGRRQGFVIANVLTRTAHDGHMIVYEGQLVEIAITGSKAIVHVCLEGVSRFALTIGADGARTTPRPDFTTIDRTGHIHSRLTIPGPEIVNIVTRSHLLTVDDAETDTPPSPAGAPPA